MSDLPVAKKKNYVKLTDPDFQSLLKTLEQEYERVRSNIEYAEIRDDPSVFENELVTYPNVCEEFGQFDVLEYHPEIIQQLIKIFPQTDGIINIYFQIDFASYIVSIKDMYNKIFEDTFPYYMFYNSKFPERLLSIIDEWHWAFDKKLLNIEILLPLKGFYLGFDKEEKEKKIIIKNGGNFSISIERIQKYGVLKKLPFGFPDGYIFNYVFSAGRFADYGIYARGNIPFQKTPYNPLPFSQIYLWSHIKEIVEVLSLEGAVLKFGAPYYRFPWWISKHIYNQFRFSHPNWINERFFGRSWAPGLVPDIGWNKSDLYSTARYVSQDLLNFLQIDAILEHKTPLDSDEKLKQDRFNKEKFISNPTRVMKIFEILKNPRSNVSFNGNSFLLDRLLRLSQQEQIEDVFLNACVILEAIFLEDFAESKGFKIATRIGNLFAGNKSEFDIIYNFYKRVYDLRNAIVHGHSDWRERDYLQLLRTQYDIKENKIDNLVIHSHPLIEDFVKSDIFSKIVSIFIELLEKKYVFPEDFTKVDFNIF